MLPERERDMQQPVLRRSSQHIETAFDIAVPVIDRNDQWLVEKYAFGFRLNDRVLVNAFAGVARVPVKPQISTMIEHVYD